MKDYDIILFDLDGTLTDSAQGIHNSFLYALEQYGAVPEDLSVLHKCVGPPLSWSFRELFGFEGDRLEGVLAAYQVYYKPRGIFENKVYEGVEELLQKLRATGKTLVVASSKKEVHVYTVLQHFGLDTYFDFIAGSDDEAGRPDKPAVIRHIIDTLPIIDLSRAVMVGDREHDVFGAAACGLDTIGVLYGYGSREELESAGAIAVAADMEELAKILGV